MRRSNIVVMCFLILMLFTGMFVLMCKKSSGITFSATPADSRIEVPIPIIMYHGITSNPAKESEYFISAKRFENDLIWLKENGFTSVLPSQLVAYVDDGDELPEKPVMISFDDGYYNNYSLALPLLEKYDTKAVISLIGADVDVSSDDQYRVLETGCLNWGEVSLMSHSGLVEFASHTYDLHKIKSGRKGAGIKEGEAFDDYIAMLSADAMQNNYLIKQATGRMPVCFAWPYGAYPLDGSGDKVLQSLGLRVTMNSYQRTSSVRKDDKDSLLMLGRYLRTPKFDLHIIA